MFLLWSATKVRSVCDQTAILRIDCAPQWRFHVYFGVFHLLQEDGLPQGTIYSQNGCLVTD